MDAGFARLLGGLPPSRSVKLTQRVVVSAVAGLFAVAGASSAAMASPQQVPDESIPLLLPVSAGNNLNNSKTDAVKALLEDLTLNDTLKALSPYRPM